MSHQQPGPALDAALQRQIDDLRANGPHIHHVADLKSGQLFSDVLAGPLSATARHQTLARLSHLFDGSIFGGPTYRVSSRNPFQASPRFFTTVSSAASYLTEVEFIAWAQARNPESRGFMVFHFDEPPPGKCIATLSFSAQPWSGTTGAVTFKGHGSSLSIPVTQSASHTVDLTFQPPAGGPAEFGFTIELGVQILAFFFMTLGPAPLVFTPD